MSRGVLLPVGLASVFFFLAFLFFFSYVFSLIKHTCKNLVSSHGFEY